MADEKDDGKGACPNGDVVSLGPDLGGVRPYLRHRPDHTLQAGLARCVADGEDIAKEGMYHLRQREGRNEYDVEPVSEATSRSGPAKVTSNAYRTGWENIFGAKTPVGKA